MELKEPKDLDSIHACERFASRIMGMEIEQGQLTYPQIEALTKKIVNIANECHPDIFKLGKGHYKCSHHECVLVLEEGVVVTVKTIEKERNSDYVGGIHRSGCKKKKLQWKKRGDSDVDLNGNNNKYPYNNGNRYDKKSRRKSLKEF